MLKLFTDHPTTVGETYWAHLLFAGHFGLRMMAGGAACLLHGLLPFLFTSTGSRTILALQAQMRHRRQEKASERLALLPRYGNGDRSRYSHRSLQRIAR
jgi:hypothetical protein